MSTTEISDGIYIRVLVWDASEPWNDVSGHVFCALYCDVMEESDENLGLL